MPRGASRQVEGLTREDRGGLLGEWGREGEVFEQGLGQLGEGGGVGGTGQPSVNQRIFCHDAHKQAPHTRALTTSQKEETLGSRRQRPEGRDNGERQHNSESLYNGQCQ